MRNLIVGAAFAALALSSGCKKKIVEPPPPDPVPVQTVELRLQITSIAPSQVAADKATTAKVYGSGFESGAKVKFGDRPAGTATVVDPNTIDVDVPGLPVGAYDVTVSNPGGQSTTLRQGLVAKGAENSCAFTRVYFDFDSASLRADGRSELNGHLACYQQGTGRIRVAGHADERGTTDYNLALGERRATTVKTHLTSQGVAASRVTTTSFGEEQPLERGSNEAAWAKNRRAEVTAE